MTNPSKISPVLIQKPFLASLRLKRICGCLQQDAVALRASLELLEIANLAL